MRDRIRDDSAVFDDGEWDALLRDLRTNRAAEALTAASAKQLPETVLRSASRSRLVRQHGSEVGPALVSVLRLAVESTQFVGITGARGRKMTDPECKDIVEHLFFGQMKRARARQHLSGKYDVTQNALREDGGIEDQVLRQLAQTLAGLEATVAPVDDSLEMEELYFGLVLWLGTDLEATTRMLETTLTEAKFFIKRIKLSSLIPRVLGAGTQYEVERPEDDYVTYVRERMEAGDSARELSPSILAEAAVEAVVEAREEFLASDANSVYRGIAYIFDSIMHHEELRVLRETYGAPFFLIAVSQDEESRFRRILKLPGIAQSRLRLGKTGVETEVRALIRKNRGGGRRALIEKPKSHTLSIEKVFHLADVFVDADNPRSRRRSRAGEEVSLTEWSIERFLEQIFSNPENTPTRHELGMAHAFVESTRSAAITRQVGAALCSRDGELIATGANEVPAQGGGQHPVPGVEDARDPAMSHSLYDKNEVSVDPNDDIKLEMLRDLLTGLVQMGLITSDEDDVLFDLDFDDLVAADERAGKIIRERPELRNALFFDVIEFTRAVHAEMAAMFSAARRGASVQDTVIYCTTFPCHECARHLIVAGVFRVVYIEPYPKSRVAQLHDDAVVLRHRDEHDGKKVEFVPYIGISPNRQPQLYSPLKRKRYIDGYRSRFVEWSIASAPIRSSIVSSDLVQRAQDLLVRDDKESNVISTFRDMVDDRTGVR